MTLAAQNEVGPANRQLALGAWSAEQCAEQYIAFFQNLTQARKIA
jgi:hypothetical protein